MFFAEELGSFYWRFRQILGWSETPQSCFPGAANGIGIKQHRNRYHRSGIGVKVVAGEKCSGKTDEGDEACEQGDLEGGPLQRRQKPDGSLQTTNILKAHCREFGSAQCD